MKNNKIRLSWLLWGLALTIVIAITIPVLADGGLSLDWWTIDGGGGSSMGGSFALDGTISQPDTGSSSGGNYQLSGGYWGAPGPVGTIDNAVFIPVMVN